MNTNSGVHTMTGDILEMRKIDFVIEGLTRWIGQSGLPEDVTKIALEELAEKFGLTDTMVKEILAVLE